MSNYTVLLFRPSYPPWLNNGERVTVEIEADNISMAVRMAKNYAKENELKIIKIIDRWGAVLP